MVKDIGMESNSGMAKTFWHLFKQAHFRKAKLPWKGYQAFEKETRNKQNQLPWYPLFVGKMNNHFPS